ncbi:hypothetical protein ACI798_08905 [Geodermatophilus sp. SYSU D01045]
MDPAPAPAPAPPGYLRALVRRGLGPGARTTDRVELVSWLASVLLAVAVVPVALAVASVVASDTGALAERQAAQLRQVPAVLLADAEVLPGSPTSLRATAPARWRAPDGATREDTVPVVPGTPAGATVPVWTGPDGGRSAPPIEGTDVAVVSVTSGVLTLLLGLATAAVTHAGVCAWAGRARDRAWAREWAEVEPLWAHRFRLR